VNERDKGVFLAPPPLKGKFLGEAEKNNDKQMRRGGGGGGGREERAAVCSSDEEYRAMTVQARRHVWMGAIPLHLHLHSSEVTSLPAPPPFLVHPKLCLSLSLFGCPSLSLSLSLSLFLFLRFWACEHGLQTIAGLFFITLMSFFFFVMDIFLKSTSLGVTYKSVFELPHMDGMGRRRREFDPLMGHNNRCLSVCLCVSFPTDGIGRRFIPYWPQPNLSVSSLSVSHTHHGKKI
jgi:hypothetical protein